jgi:hypothetical protein
LTNVPDFGDIECGDGDTDCGVCIVIGGVPAMSCSVCEGHPACSGGQILCSGDPNECSTDVTGACCPNSTEFSGAVALS